MKTTIHSILLALALLAGVILTPTREAAAQFPPIQHQAVLKSVRCLDMQDEGTRFDNIYVLITADGQTERLRNRSFNVGTKHAYNEPIAFTQEAVIQVVEDDQGVANFGRGGDDFFDEVKVSAADAGRGPKTFTVQYRDPIAGDLGIYEVVVEVLGSQVVPPGPGPGPGPAPFNTAPTAQQLTSGFWHEARLGQTTVYKIQQSGFNQFSFQVTTIVNNRIVSSSNPQLCQYDASTGMLQLGNEGTFQVTLRQNRFGPAALTLTDYRGFTRSWE